MGRPRGFPKTGGRKPGTPNKNSQALIEKLHNLGCDPIEGLAKIAMEAANKPDLRFRCLAELAQYIYPKRKAVDFSLGESDTHPIIVEFIGGRPEAHLKNTANVAPQPLSTVPPKKRP